MLNRLLRSPRGVEVGVAIPIGCMVIAAAVLVGAGVFAGTRLAPAADHVVVRVIDDGAAGGPQVISTQVVPLR